MHTHVAVSIQAKRGIQLSSSLASLLEEVKDEEKGNLEYDETSDVESVIVKLDEEMM